MTVLWKMRKVPLEFSIYFWHAPWLKDECYYKNPNVVFLSAKCRICSFLDNVLQSVYIPQSYTQSFLPQSACLVVGARPDLQVILGRASGCTVRAGIVHCEGWSRSPFQTAPGDTGVEQARKGQSGDVNGPGFENQFEAEPPGREWEQSVILQLRNSYPFACS